MDPEDRLELITLLAQDRAWDAVVAVGRALLDHSYPASVFDGSSGDTGPQYVVALRTALARIETADSRA
jgi:hypothetical protein